MTGATGARRGTPTARPRTPDRRIHAAALLVLAGLLSGCGDVDERDAAARSTSPTATPAQSPPSTTRPNTALPRATQEPAGSDQPQPGTRPAPPPLPQAVATATRFAAAWARPDLPADRWWNGVAPWCEQRFAALLRTVDPANIPARRVTGPPRPAAGHQPGLITYTVPTDAGTLTVTVAALAGTWQVTNNDFRRTGR